MSEWKPIETAPKDGTILVLYEPGIGLTTGAWSENVHPWNDGDWWVEGGQVTGKPTHWTLPEPPKS